MRHDQWPGVVPGSRVGSLSLVRALGAVAWGLGAGGGFAGAGGTGRRAIIALPPRVSCPSSSSLPDIRPVSWCSQAAIAAAISDACIHAVLACSSPEGRCRSAAPCLLSRKILRGCISGRTGHLPDLARSAIDQHRVVTPQVLHQRPCPETAKLRAAATRSTTLMEVCCKSSPSGRSVQFHATARRPLEKADRRPQPHQENNDVTGGTAAIFTPVQRRAQRYQG